jgi:hypothetical protein
MKGGSVPILVVVVALAHSVAASNLHPPSAKGNLQYVNPFIGTDGQTQSEYGGMIPSTGNSPIAESDARIALNQMTNTGPSSSIRYDKVVSNDKRK